jgi:putative salt-induced outer membrane protein YdiY
METDYSLWGNSEVAAETEEIVKHKNVQAVTSRFPVMPWQMSLGVASKQ